MSLVLDGVTTDYSYTATAADTVLDDIALALANLINSDATGTYAAFVNDATLIIVNREGDSFDMTVDVEPVLTPAGDLTTRTAPLVSLELAAVATSSRRS